MSRRVALVLEAALKAQAHFLDMLRKWREGEDFILVDPLQGSNLESVVPQKKKKKRVHKVQIVPRSIAPLILPKIVNFVKSRTRIWMRGSRVGRVGP